MGDGLRRTTYNCGIVVPLAPIQDVNCLIDKFIELWYNDVNNDEGR